jgi:hypothetical protein
MARTIDGAPTGQGGGGCARQQDRTDGLRQQMDWHLNWRGHDNAMQIWSFRGLGQPAWVALLKVRVNARGPIRAEH